MHSEAISVSIIKFIIYPSFTLNDVGGSEKSVPGDERCHALVLVPPVIAYHFSGKNRRIYTYNVYVIKKVYHLFNGRENDFKKTVVLWVVFCKSVNSADKSRFFSDIIRVKKVRCG